MALVGRSEGAPKDDEDDDHSRMRAPKVSQRSKLHRHYRMGRAREAKYKMAKRGIDGNLVESAICVLEMARFKGRRNNPSGRKKSGAARSSAIGQ